MSNYNCTNCTFESNDGRESMWHAADNDHDVKPAVRPAETCDALARRGTGQGICDRPLDLNGYCDRAGDHV